MSTSTTLCPSSPLEPGVVLVGVALTDGSIAYAADRVELGPEFVAAVKQADSPERLFRFAGPCRNQGCQQWTGGQCGVINRLVEVNSHIKTEEALPQCSIRPQCRWFNQEGAKACTLCPYIITDSRPLAAEGRG